MFRDRITFKFRVLMVLLGPTLLSCEKKEEVLPESDALLGTWTSGCGPLLTEYQINLAVNPTSSSIEERLAKFYHRKTFVFSDDASEDTFSDTGLIAETMLKTTTNVYFNDDADSAAECNSDDLFATQEEVWTYSNTALPLATNTTVNVENGFPEDAKPLNLVSSLLVSRTYTSDAMVAALNRFDICESTSWEAETSKLIADKRNCFAHPLALTDALTDIPSDSIVDPDYESRAFASEFISGRGLFSIYLADISTNPKTLKVGIPAIDSDGSFTSEEKLNQAKTNGDSEVHRHTRLSEEMIVEE